MKFFLTPLYVLSLLFAFPLYSQIPGQIPKVRGRDITPQYTDIYSRVNHEFLKVLPQLRKYKILYVPGLFSNLINYASRVIPTERETLLASYTEIPSRLTQKPSLFETYRILRFLSQEKELPVNNLSQPFMSWLIGLGIDFKRLPINSEGTSDANALIILKELEKADKPVLLISRSKGGNDSLYAYLQNSSLFTRKVYGWISIQTPFYGSPVADIFTENIFLRKMADYFLQVFGGSIQTLEALSLKKAKRFHQLYASSIQKLVNRTDFAFLSVGAYIEDDRKRWDTIFEPLFRDYIHWKTGYENDGIVPWKSAILSGTDYLVLPETDHLVTTSGSLGPLAFNEKKFIHSLLTLMTKSLKQIEVIRPSDVTLPK